MKTIDLAENDPLTHIKFAELAKIIFKARKSAVITGAGISCNAGIPDFRSSEGLYNLVKEKHPTAVVKGQDLFDISLFRSEISLAVFCTFMESLYLSTLRATPTETHKFIKILKEKKKLLRCYTQNIDGLERNIELKTGVRSDQFESGKTFLQSWKSLDVVQLHGDLHHLSCTHCFHTTQWTPKHKLQLSQGENPECQNCFMKYQERLYLGKRLTGNIGLLRPAIVLYGENHPQAEILAQGLNCDVRAKPDMLIIMGTSLRVDGVKKLVKTLASAVHDKGGKVVFVNKTPLAKTTWENIIDYEVLCDCDDFVAQLKYEIPDLFLTQEQLDSKRLKNKRVKRVKKESDSEEKEASKEVKKEINNENLPKEFVGSLLVGLTPPTTPHKKGPALKRKSLSEKLVSSKPKLNFELPTPLSSFSEADAENFNALKIKKEERDCEPLLLAAPYAGDNPCAGQNCVSRLQQQLLSLQMDLVAHLCESVFSGDTQPQSKSMEKTENEPDGSQKKPNTDFQSFWNYYYAKSEPESHHSDEVEGSHEGTETLKSAGTSAANNSLLSDKLMEKVIQMMIPMNVESSEIISQRLAVQSTRPSLSINSMSTNSTLLALRLSYTFQCIDAITIYFSWREPSYTLAILLVITHAVLRPELLLAFPCLYLITNVLIPHYLIRHPPDNSLKELLGRSPIPADGEPLRSYSIPKPVPQFSQEFLLNLTDLQNHQLDFVAVYDFIVWLTKDYLYFKDEAVSSLVFILLLSFSFYNAVVLPKVICLVWKYLPIKFFLIVFVWLSTLAFHPVVKNYLLNLIFDERTRIAVVSNNNRIETYLIRVLFHKETPTQETKEAEIFELQKLLAKTSIWEPVGFTNEVFTINNPTRRTTSHLLSTLVEGFNEFEDKNNDDDESENEDLDSDSDGEVAVMSHINNCSNLDEIDPPLGWKFDSKWVVDLHPTEWVSNRMIDDVVSVDTDEKWVYDAPIDLNSMYRRRRWVRMCRRETRR